jgi:hypothetical protein
MDIHRFPDRKPRLNPYLQRVYDRIKNTADFNHATHKFDDEDELFLILDNKYITFDAGEKERAIRTWFLELGSVFGLDSPVATMETAETLFNRYLYDRYEDEQNKQELALSREFAEGTDDEEEKDSGSDNGYRRGGIIGTFRKMKKNLFH